MTKIEKLESGSMLNAIGPLSGPNCGTKSGICSAAFNLSARVQYLKGILTRLLLTAAKGSSYMDYPARRAEPRVGEHTAWPILHFFRDFRLVTSRMCNGGCEANPVSYIGRIVMDKCIIRLRGTAGVSFSG